MSDRERWIIYPLLFASLSFGVRERYGRPDKIRYRTIECNELTIKTRQNQPRVTLTANGSSGAVVLYADNRPSLQLRSTGAGGKVEIMNQQGAAIATIGASPDGGVVKLQGERGRSTILLGHDHELSVGGLVALDDRDDLVKQPPTAKEGVWGFPLIERRSNQARVDGDPSAAKTAEPAGENVPDTSTAGDDADAGGQEAPVGDGE